MPETTITVPTVDGPMRAYLATPDGADRAPALVVLQEAYGVNAHIQDVCRRLAREGYAALAPELYHRFGEDMVFSYDDGPHAVAELAKLDNAAVETDVLAALAALRARPDIDRARVGTLGFCMGGFASFLAACRSDARTSICFYPGGLVSPRPMFKLAPLLPEIDRIRTPVLLFFGDADHAISTDDIDRLRGELKGHAKVHEIVVYPTAGHGFFCEDRASYHPESAEDAWGMTLGWLRERL